MTTEASELSRDELLKRYTKKSRGESDQASRRSPFKFLGLDSARRDPRAKARG
jgi:hypothetical protein